MSVISDEYRELNKELHKARKSYGASGSRWAKKVEELYDYGTVLDYGCGKGTLKQALKGVIPVNEYDPCIAGKDKKSPHRWIVCTDVLEHIEPDSLDEVLRDIADLSEVAFLVVATRKANKTLPDGRNAHLIIQPMDWWLKKIEEYFSIDWAAEDGSQPGEFSCLVRSLR